MSASGTQPYQVSCCICLNDGSGRKVPADTILDGYAVCAKHSDPDNHVVSMDGKTFQLRASIDLARGRRPRQASST